MKRFKFKSVIALANQRLTVKSTVIVLGASTLLSAFLGLYRDYLLNSYYLQTYPTGIDAYTAAFTIPDFMFFILTSGALAVSFIPVFNQRLVVGNKDSAWKLSTSILNLLASITLIASILMIIFAEPLVKYIVGPGLDEPGTALAINMMRVIAINPFLMSIATVLSSIQQAVGRFIAYAFAPAVYNIGILIGITCFTDGIDIFGIHLFDGGIMGVALGVVFGAILQVIVSLVGVFGLGFDYSFKIFWKNKGFKDVLKLLPARSLDQGIDYVNTIVNTNLSSRMGAGALRSFNQANSLHNMPVNLIGVAISTAFFPKLTEELGGGDEQKFYDTFRKALRTIIWITLPVAIISLFCRGYVVSFISNLKNNESNNLIASVLGALVLGIFARSVFHIASRGFYAYQDTKTPFIVSIIAIGSTMLLSVLFYLLNFGAVGLGWAQSIGAFMEIIILIAILQKRSNGRLLNYAFFKAFFRMIFATGVTGAVAYSMTKFLPLMSSDKSIFITLPKFCIISILSLVIYILASYFLNLEELNPVVEKINVIFKKTKHKLKSLQKK